MVQDKFESQLFGSHVVWWLFHLDFSSGDLYDVAYAVCLLRDYGNEEEIKAENDLE